MRILIVIAALAMLSTSASAAEKMKVEILQQWSGKIAEDAAKAVAPKTAFIADAEAFKKLWKAWRGNEEVPAVDFAKEIVLISTTDGPNMVRLSAMIDDAGNVSVIGMATKMAGPGFGYALGRISREGVKSVEGNAVAAGK